MLQFPDPASENENSLRQPSDPLKRPWYRLRPQTFALLVGLILAAGILEIFPFVDRPDNPDFPGSFLTQKGVPLIYGITDFESTRVHFPSLLEDILAVGALILALTCLMERWIRRAEG